MRKLFNTPLRATITGIFILMLAGTIAKAVDNYAATAGSGLTFAAKLISAVLYPQFLLCDPTSGATKCAPVDATTGLGVNITAGLNTNGPKTSANSAPTVLATDEAAIPLWGHGATAAAVPANGVLDIGRGASTEPTAVTDGQSVAKMLTLAGKTVTLPYAPKELAVRGSVTSTDTGAHTIIASAGGSLKNYITDWECSNSSATSTLVTFNDSAATIIIVPAGGGNNKSLHIPLATAAATAFTFTSGTGVSTVYCSAQGYTSP
jgi:hypothetical protein